MAEKLKEFFLKLATTRLLSGSTIKILACVSMFVDHCFHILMHKYREYILTLDYDSIMRIDKIYKAGRAFGRLAFPIYCFLLVEGFFHTRNLKKYMLRLAALAVLSEHAFNLLASSKHLDLTHQSVYLTLLISLITICGMNKVVMRNDYPYAVKAVLTGLILAAGCAAAWGLKTDYKYYGVLAVAIMYMLHFNRVLTCIGGAAAFYFEPWAIPAFIPILLYNGKRGLKAKYVFYFFYPVHIYFIYYVVYYLLPDM
jgi:hypothetical protein